MATDEPGILLRTPSKADSISRNRIRFPEKMMWLKSQAARRKAPHFAFKKIAFPSNANLDLTDAPPKIAWPPLPHKPSSFQ